MKFYKIVSVVLQSFINAEADKYVRVIIMPCKIRKYRKCVGKKMKGQTGSKDDMRKSFREAAQACKAKLDNVL